MQFKVSFENKIRTVRLDFGNDTDLDDIRHWKAPRGYGANPHIRDSIEYSRLASKRWRYYRREDSTAESLPALRQALRRDPESETAFFLVARAAWFPRRRRSLASFTVGGRGAITSSSISPRVIRRCSGRCGCGSVASARECFSG